MKTEDFRDFRPGVLNKQQLEFLESESVIQNADISQDPESALDLHIGNEYWEMVGCIKGLGTTEPYYRILQNEKYYTKHTDNVSQSEIIELERRKTYVFTIKERMRYYEEYVNKFHAFATGRSSIGRLDVLIRLIEDSSPYYDRVSTDNPGPLFLEVTPITFNIKVRPNITLNQLRIFYGDPKWSELDPDQLKRRYWGDFMVDDSGQMVRNIEKLTLNLEPDKHGDEEFMAFKARDDAPSIDLTRDYTKKQNRLDPKLYWEGMPPSGEKVIKIQRGSFYILRSRERFRLPNDIAVYCEAVSEEFGEIRIHYAGFVHPCFGLYRDDGKGAPLTLEVRGHTLDTFLRHGETLATIRYYRMSQPQEYTAKDIEKEKKRGYSGQELNLSNIFKDWE